jgi:hypothetical protein
VEKQEYLIQEIAIGIGAVAMTLLAQGSHIK